ncbi:hypothetical protein GCM10023310_25650 [Paenibacillus vulneris]|uniref:DUF4190 domain-containing protein n=1 Tax=Paenibacillus vulneris TaxID=1133364 RepID=A0ABW3US60_9BACL|nr:MULTISPECIES: hypothetical protein [unclassified Paenibacillus]MBE1445455.1 uncharacterized membrane protein YhaH (DUF805 family) [Paenibacillus sp. OAS669]
MSNARIAMLVTALLEGILGIPLLGGSIVIGFSYTPLFVMFVLHIITLVLALKEYKDIHGSIAGIITSCIAWIPIVGMICHILTAILLFVSYFKYQYGRWR